MNYVMKEKFKNNLLGNLLLVVGILFIIVLVFSVGLIICEGINYGKSIVNNNECYEVVNQERINGLYITKFKDISNGKIYMFVNNGNSGSLLEIGE